MKTRVAIYGFGRLGRAIYTIAARRSDLEVVVVVADDTVESIVDALLTDSIYAALEQNVEIADGGFTHNERHITVHKVRKETLWRDHTVDVVIDTVTKNPSVSDEKAHRKAGADKVIFCHKTAELPLVGIGINEDKLKKIGHSFSAGGPEFAATKPVTDIIAAAFGVEHFVSTTVNGSLCGSACDCAEDCDCCESSDNIVAPVLVASVTELTLLVKHAVTEAKVNDALTQAASDRYYQGIVTVVADGVAPDAVIGESISALVDLKRTAVDGRLISLKLWYDREWSYANRIVELTADYGKIKEAK